MLGMLGNLYIITMPFLPRGDNERVLCLKNKEADRTSLSPFTPRNIRGGGGIQLQSYINGWETDIHLYRSAEFLDNVNISIVYNETCFFCPS